MKLHQQKEGAQKLHVSLLVIHLSPMMVMTRYIANSRNLEALKKEMEQGKPRKEFVLSLMKETFTSCWEVILSDTTTSVATILEKQDALSLPFAVSDKVYWTIAA